LAQTAELLRSDGEYLEEAAQGIFDEAIDLDLVRINRLCLRPVPLALQRRVMRQFLSKYLKIAPTFEQIESLTNLIQAPNRTRTSPFPGGAIAEVQEDWIILSYLPNNFNY